MSAGTTTNRGEVAESLESFRTATPPALPETLTKLLEEKVWDEVAGRNFGRANLLMLPNVGVGRVAFDSCHDRVESACELIHL